MTLLGQGPKEWDQVRNSVLTGDSPGPKEGKGGGGTDSTCKQGLQIPE